MGKITILLTYLIICFNSYSGIKLQKDTLVCLNEYMVTNKMLINLLDTAIDHELKFFRRNCTFDINVYEEYDQIKLSIGILDEILLKYFDDSFIGYFKYRGSIFLISHRLNAKIKLKKFYRKKKGCKYFTFQYYSGEIMPTVDETSWFYYYKNGKFVIDYLFDFRIQK